MKDAISLKHMPYIGHSLRLNINIFPIIISSELEADTSSVPAKIK